MPLKRRPRPRPVRRSSLLHLLRPLTPSHLVYLFLSICLTLFILAIILAPRYHPLHIPQSTLLSSPSYSALGSAKQLALLLHNITTVTPSPPSSSISTIPSSSPSALIVVVAVNYAYRRLAVNFVCNLHRLAISNYLVLAMDLPVFHYLQQRSINVFFHTLHHPIPHGPPVPPALRHLPRRHLTTLSSAQQHDAPAQFGTSAFLETSVRKSELVLRVLALGHPVLFSDVDVVWVRNPIVAMTNLSAHFVIASDIPAIPIKSTTTHSQTAHLSPNLALNSGLYLAQPTRPTIIALRAIVKFARAIRRSEQKAFNFVLCGAFRNISAGPGKRIGHDRCEYSHAGTTAVVLPLLQFPNGSLQQLWAPTRRRFAKQFPRVVAVHANYVQGRAEKVSRIRSIGYWFHSEEALTREQCVFPPPRTDPDR